MHRKPKKSFISNAMRWRVGLLAVLMWVALMAPGISRWLAAAEGSTWVEVCSVQGMRWVQADASREASSSDESAPQAPLEACAYCTLANDRPWVDTSPIVWALPMWPSATVSTWVRWHPPKVFVPAPTARGPPHFL